MKKRVLLTGATGFIGRWTVPRLLALGYEVHAADILDVQSITRNWGGVQMHQCNLLNKLEQRHLIEEIRPSHLLHFAWDVTHGKFWHSRSNLKWVNASISLLESFSACGGQRVVMAGTCAEYDWSYGYCKENVTPLNPNTFYGVCKNSLASILLSFGQTHGVSAAWGRVFHLYGPAENRERFVPSIILGMLKNETVQCTHGNQIRDFMHVEDVAAGFVALLDSDVEGAINISSGHPVSLKSIIERVSSIAKFNGYIDFGALPSDKKDPPVLFGDASRLEGPVGFKSKYSLDEGLKAVFSYWKQLENEA